MITLINKHVLYNVKLNTITLQEHYEKSAFCIKSTWRDCYSTVYTLYFYKFWLFVIFCILFVIFCNLSARQEDKHCFEL